MNFRPLHDRVVVRRIEEDTKTAGGIIIPDTAQEKPMQGEVVAVGDGARDDAGKLFAVRHASRTLSSSKSISLAGINGLSRWRASSRLARKSR